MRSNIRPQNIHWKQAFLKGMGFLLCAVMALILVNCDQNFFESTSDDNSYDARVEKGVMALDDEDYDEAVKIFEKLKKDYPGKVEVCEYLSNAYSGFIGVDTFRLLETIDELEQNDDAGNIEMVGRVLGGESGDLTAGEVIAKRVYLVAAIEAFIECIPVRDNDQKVQLGLMAVFDSALIVGEIVLEDLGADQIALTEAGLKSLYSSRPDFTDVTSLDSYLAELNQNLALVLESVTALAEISGGAEGNDLSEAFDEFLGELGYGGADDPVTADDLENYIATL